MSLALPLSLICTPDMLSPWISLFFAKIFLFSGTIFHCHAEMFTLCCYCKRPFQFVRKPFSASITTFPKLNSPTCSGSHSSLSVGEDFKVIAQLYHNCYQYTNVYINIYCYQYTVLCYGWRLPWVFFPLRITNSPIKSLSLPDSTVYFLQR